MPRPKSKDELILLSNQNFDKLMTYIEELPPEIREAEFHSGTMNRNIRDVLAHLHHWHLMMIRWYNEGMAGQKPQMPAPGFTWKTVPDLNREIWKHYADYDFKKVKDLLFGTFEDLQEIIKNHSNDELFQKKRYKWTGSTSLGAYLISATSSHYDWAQKLIKKGLK